MKTKRPLLREDSGLCVLYVGRSRITMLTPAFGESGFAFGILEAAQPNLGV